MDSEWKGPFAVGAENTGGGTYGIDYASAGKAKTDPSLGHGLPLGRANIKSLFTICNRLHHTAFSISCQVHNNT